MTNGELQVPPHAPDPDSDPSRQQAAPRTPADIKLAIYESGVLVPQTLAEREALALGVPLAARICADPTLLERGATTAAAWIAVGGTEVTRSLRDWETLCRAGDVDSVQWALLALTVYAAEMRASMPLVDLLDNAEAAAIHARVRSEKAPSQVPIAVWREIAEIVDTHLTPVELLSMCMSPSRMLPDATGRIRTVIEALEEGDYGPVLAMLRWVTTSADDGAPRIANRPEMTND